MLLNSRKMSLRWILIAAAVLALTGLTAAQGIPKLTIGVQDASEPQDVVVTIQILALLTFLVLAPALLLMMTSFTRIIVVLHFLRQALGTQQTPPSQLLIGLALFLTFFIMGPALTQINDNALQPYLAKEISQKEALHEAAVPMKAFMLKQTRDQDLGLFFRLGNYDRPQTAMDTPMAVLIPSFVISELRIAFQIGFLLYLPFLIIDMVVAAVLLAMGMMMLPPVMISLPFKILLFVLVDGWYLVIQSMISGYY
jgi:flagellar biosynthetic protein FliP